MEQKTDLRVIKTQNALVQAMRQSLHDKPFEEITVQYICDLAMVRRATFYTHFADKYELFSFTVRRVYQEFPSQQRGNDDDENEKFNENIIRDAVDFLAENAVAFKLVVNSKLTHIVLDIIRNELEQEFLSTIQANLQRRGIHDLSSKLILNYWLYGIFGSFMWWIQEGYPVSKEELVVQIQSMLHIPDNSQISYSTSTIS